MKLPVPQPMDHAQSDLLKQTIRQQIEKAGGVIPFAQFMALALYTPGLGFYMKNSVKFGTRGHFITAPEISPLFAHCIARQYQQLSLDSFLEIGAGSGQFAKDFLSELARLHRLPKHYFILEISPALREQQQKLLQDFSNVIWLETLPENFSGMIFANEVMDAFPVNCFCIAEEKMFERCVRLHEDNFQWSLEETELRDHIPQIKGITNKYYSEINLGIAPWIRTLANCLKQGVILLFDYGYGRTEYYHPDRSQGTLMCFYQHHMHEDPFMYPGLQDMTAHVDFTTVADSAIDAGLALSGYTTQAGFLLSAGLLECSLPENTIEQYQHAQAIKKLTMPSQMGELIKVMALSKNSDEALLGFSLQDRRQHL